MSTITFDVNTASATQPLNPILLSALALVFPDQREQLHITHLGQRPVRKKGPLGHTLPPEEYGEQYVMNCPFCGDSRGRMRISHTYDPGHSAHHWFCFNEDCQKYPEFRAYLADQLRKTWLAAKQQLVHGQLPPELLQFVQVTGDSTDITPQLPEGMVDLWSLPPGHPAREYVAQRQFDEVSLSRDWGIGYSEHSGVPAPRFHQRIVIPFHGPSSDGSRVELMGWQSRSLNNAPSEPKYLTMAGMRKSHLLYTHPQGIYPSERLIIAEGVTDVWRLGADAIGLLGKQASAHQIKLIVEAARPRRAILVALDSDADSEADKLIQQLQRATRNAGYSIPVVRCRPKGQKDFGDCNGFETKLAIAEAMAMAANTPVPHTTRFGRPLPDTLTADTPRSRKELAERLVSHATPANHPLITDIEARVAELGMTSLLDYIEAPLLPMISEMECVGLRVDLDRLGVLAAGNSKLQTQANSLIGSLSPATGRIHATLDQLGARTGRIMTRKFNLQGFNRSLRSAVVADEGRQLICADFSQFEWRLAAAISGDATLLDWCADPSIDLYGEVASRISGTPREAVTNQTRAWIKILMMRFLYSSENSDPNDDQLWHFLSRLFPGLLDWRERQVAQSLQSGVVRTMMGRVIAIDRDAPQATLFNRATNYVIQGTASDVFKCALLSVHKAIPSEVRMLLPHHDSILLDAPEAVANEIIPALRSAIEIQPPGCPILFPCKIRSGKNWAEITGS